VAELLSGVEEALAQEKRLKKVALVEVSHLRPAVFQPYSRLRLLPAPKSSG
jgi:hypothetical protein